MASSGQNFNQTVNVAEPRDAVSQALIAGTAGVQDRAKGTALLRKACAGGVASACTTGDGGT